METIDQFHKKQMDYFQEIKNIIIPSFQKERIVLKNKLIVENNYEEKLLIIDKIKEIREKIKNIKFLEKNYLLKNMNHLEIYYNNKKEVENNNNEKTVLNEFFNISPVEETVENTNDKFWNCNNKPHLKYYNQNMCQSCDMEMKETEDGFYICDNCFFINKNVINENKNENTIDRIVNNTSYMRMAYFKKVINQLNGRPTMKIKPEIIVLIKSRIEIEKIQIINFYVIKNLLKKLKLKKYIDQIVHIISLLGITVPQMSDHLVDKMCFLFQAIQEPFQKYCPKIRSNFFPYHFIVYKFLLYLGETQYIQNIPILKNIEKYQNQNELFEKCIGEISI